MADDVTYKIAGREVVASGSLILSYGDDTAMITFSGLQLKIIFEKGDRPEAFSEIENAESMLLRFRGYASPYPIFYSAKIGAINNRQLHAVFVVTSGPGDEKPARLVNYTFSLGSEVAGGE